MINRNNFVFSKAAAARILGVPVNLIVGFQRWAKVCWVWVAGRRPTFMSFKAFKQHFVDWRKQQAKGLYVAPAGEQQFRIVNPKKGTAYSVWAWWDGLDCECEDYKNQISILRQGCCKHGYAVLTWLGFSTLKEYLESPQE